MKKVLYLSFAMLTLLACKKEEVNNNNPSSGSTNQVPLSDKIIGHWESHQDELDYDFNLKFCNDGTYLKDFKYNWQFVPCAVDYVEEGSWSVVGDTILLISQSGAIQKYGVNTIVSNQSLGVNFPTCSGGRMNFNYSFVSSNGCTGGSGGTGGVSYSQGSGVTDIDGNSYETVVLGNGQEWMSENLKVEHFNNGSSVYLIDNQPDWASNNYTQSPNPAPAYCYPEDDISNKATYGNLYNWYVVDDSRGICPQGWHVPSGSEFEELSNYLGGPYVAGGKMKNVGTQFWNSPNEAADNSSGLNVLPCPNKTYDGYSATLGFSAHYWASEEVTAISSHSAALWYDRAELQSSYFVQGSTGKAKNFGFCIRCIKD